MARGAEQSGEIHAELGARARASAEALHPGGGRSTASYEVHLGDGRFMRVLGPVDEASVAKLLRAMGWASRSIAASAEISRVAEVTAEVTTELRRAAELGSLRRMSAEVGRVAEITAELSTELEWVTRRGTETTAERGAERSTERSAEQSAEPAPKKTARKAAKKPAANKPVANEPAAKRPAAKKPAAKKTAKKRATRRGARNA